MTRDENKPENGNLADLARTSRTSIKAKPMPVWMVALFLLAGGAMGTMFSSAVTLKLFAEFYASELDGACASSQPVKLHLKGK
ncbi:hypothetical protein ACQU0X_31645 [Pseudovibrio ascidiaceicola]|uniref:hypothetical protein n=1 Tax=Pseudovibrio ascidiaceicola TaxID=285279 RepID=UPI003D369931